MGPLYPPSRKIQDINPASSKLPAKRILLQMPEEEVIFWWTPKLANHPGLSSEALLTFSNIFEKKMDTYHWPELGGRGDIYNEVNSV